MNIVLVEFPVGGEGMLRGDDTLAGSCRLNPMQLEDIERRIRAVCNEADAEIAIKELDTPTGLFAVQLILWNYYQQARSMQARARRKRDGWQSDEYKAYEEIALESQVLYYHCRSLEREMKARVYKNA